MTATTYRAAIHDGLILKAATVALAVEHGDELLAARATDSFIDGRELLLIVPAELLDAPVADGSTVAREHGLIRTALERLGVRESQLELDDDGAPVSATFTLVGEL